MLLFVRSLPSYNFTTYLTFDQLYFRHDVINTVQPAIRRVFNGFSTLSNTDISSQVVVRALLNGENSFIFIFDDRISISTFLIY